MRRKTGSWPKRVKTSMRSFLKKRAGKSNSNSMLDFNEFFGGKFESFRTVQYFFNLSHGGVKRAF